MSNEPQTTPSEDEQVTTVGAALAVLAKDPQPVLIEISKKDAILLYGCLQLSLRHPETNGQPAAVARIACDAIRALMLNSLQGTALLGYFDENTDKAMALLTQRIGERIRPLREIEEAHCILKAVLNGETPLEPTPDERAGMGQALLTICWLLLHPSGRAVSDSLFNIKTRLRGMGYQFARRSDETASPPPAQRGDDAHT